MRRLSGAARHGALSCRPGGRYLALVDCVLHTPCVADGRPLQECMMDRDAVQRCKDLRQAFTHCQRGQVRCARIARCHPLPHTPNDRRATQLDARYRIRGNRYGR